MYKVMLDLYCSIRGTVELLSDFMVYYLSSKKKSHNFIHLLEKDFSSQKHKALRKNLN